MIINVAIDGPAGAGKSTIAKECAKRLGIIYVDTGALYRSIGLYVIKCGKDYNNSEDVISCLPSIELSLKFCNGAQCVILNGEDVSEQIRTPEVSMAASGVSSVPMVREYLLDLQRNMAKNNSVIMDGRDIGTVILPNADVKIFLTASPEERASRRYKELLEKGENVTYGDILNDIVLRDKQDSTRKIAPLKPAKDSVTIDTTGKSLEQSVDILYNLINSRCNNNE